ncbi:MAG: response regulator [Campylobacterales bacterium]|nr:response regulator [Campylobacterales bacterium]
MNNVPYKNITVLIVEDEDTQRKILYFMLKKMVSEVYMASDGEEGLESFKKYKPVLVITDINMPKLSGLDMLRGIKQLDPNVATVVISGTENKEDLIEAIDIGANKFLSRPIKKDKLEFYIKRLNQLYEGKKRAKAEHELLEQYKKIIDKTMLVTKTDSKGRITYINQNFLNVSGYESSELMGNNHNIIRHPDMPSEVFKDLWTTILKKEVWKGTVKNKKKDGGFYIVNATIIPILNEDNEISEFISIRDEITDQYIKKEKEKLEKEKENLEKVAKTKESFLVVFTHELKTPLNAIISFSQYVHKKVFRSDIKGKDEILELLTEVKENANDMLYNITNILEISRLKENKLSFNKKDFILEDIIMAIDKQFAAMILKEGIDITYDIPNKTKLYCDEQRLKQILSNLISNGIKYGEKTIKVKVTSNKESFIIDVEDNGPGIKNKDAVFGLFEQEEDDDMTRTSKGTGVGLFFIKKLCESFNYKIEILDSQELGGAHFRVSGKIKC